MKGRVDCVKPFVSGGEGDGSGRRPRNTWHNTCLPKVGPRYVHDRKKWRASSEDDDDDE